MPTVEVHLPVRHAAAEMFELVTDLERYPLFLPLCEKLVVKARSQESGKDVVIADMTVGYKAFRESFTSRVVIDRGPLAVDFSYVTGPFRRLVGSWRFEPTSPRRSTVHFRVDYEFRSRVLAVLMGGVFDHAFKRFVAAFEARADLIYGSSAKQTAAAREGA